MIFSSRLICEIRLNCVAKNFLICYTFYINFSKVIFFVFLRILVHLFLSVSYLCQFSLVRFWLNLFLIKRDVFIIAFHMSLVINLSCFARTIFFLKVQNSPMYRKKYFEIVQMSYQF